MKKFRYEIIIFTVSAIEMILELVASRIIYNLNLNNLKSDALLEGEYETEVSYDTQYGRVIIYNSTLNYEPIRILNIDAGYDINNVMMIGGA